MKNIQKCTRESNSSRNLIIKLFYESKTYENERKKDCEKSERKEKELD